LATDNNTVGMGDAGIKSAIQGSNVPNPDEAVPSFVSGAMAKAGKGRPPTYQRRAPLRLPLVPRNGCGRPGRAPERFLPLDITSLLLHVIFDARFLLRQ